MKKNTILASDIRYIHRDIDYYIDNDVFVLGLVVKGVSFYEERRGNVRRDCDVAGRCDHPLVEMAGAEDLRRASAPKGRLVERRC